MALWMDLQTPNLSYQAQDQAAAFNTEYCNRCEIQVLLDQRR